MKVDGEQDFMKKWYISFSILALVWSIYYLAMHITGGILSKTDIIICGTVILLCVIMLVFYFYKQRKKK